MKMKLSLYFFLLLLFCFLALPQGAFAQTCTYNANTQQYTGTCASGTFTDLVFPNNSNSADATQFTDLRGVTIALGANCNPIFSGSTLTDNGTNFSFNANSINLTVNLEGGGTVVYTKNGNPQLSTLNGQLANCPGTCTLGAPAVLPVAFLSFAARPDGKSVQLDWATASETDNDFFEIQRSGDAVNWRTLEQIGGKGTTTEMSTYTYYDADPKGEILYYRLKQVDHDGSFTFSDVVTLALGKGPLQAFPNPTQGLVAITAQGSVSLHDLTGKVLQSQNLGPREGQLTFDLSDLPAGLYLLRAEGGTQKIVKH